MGLVVVEQILWCLCPPEFVPPTRLFKDLLSCPELQQILGPALLGVIQVYTVPLLLRFISFPFPPHFLPPYFYSPSALFSNSYYYQVLCGLPIGINLRNVIWHGFCHSVEIHPAYATFLLVLIHTLYVVCIPFFSTLPPLTPREGFFGAPKSEFSTKNCNTICRFFNGSA